jgi:subtilisin family serine protease
LENLSESLGDELKILFVTVGQSADEVIDSFGDNLPPYSVLPDETRVVSGRYGIKRIPTCVFIDEEGLIQYIGRVNEGIIWRLWSGERPIYPDASNNGVRASDRLAARHRAVLAGAKRFIVELDEKPGFWKRLSGTARKTRRAHFRQVAQRIGGRIVHNYGRLRNKVVVEIAPDKVEKLRELPRFKNFKEDRRVHALLEDSAYQIKADYAWDNAITGQGVKVCVVDTGIDYTHPDLQNKVIAQYNAITDTEDAMDDNGHGTHCAGIIASDGLQYRGVSHDVSLMAAKVLDESGNGFASDVVLGIIWCVGQGADVISLSLGEGLYSGTCDHDEMAQAVNEVVDAGVVVVCAAGNDGDSNAMVSPACASKVIAVGAVDKLDNIASYSDGGEELDVVAPGGDQLGGDSFPEIVSTYSTEVANNPLYCMYSITEECWDDWFVVDGTRYIRAVGTSMATPHVAGAAALLLEENPNLSPSQIKTALEENADDLGAPGWDNIYGWGRINIEKALDNIPPEAGEMVVTITEPNTADTLMINEEFGLAAEVDCFGGDGCGDVSVHVQFCNGYDCNDFVDINSATIISTMDDNPDALGILSGYTVETDVPVVFDAQTVLDISEEAYTKSLNPNNSLVGSTLPSEYNTGDLEPQDGIGAIGEDAQEHYEFEIPAGKVKTLKVRMENYLVLHFDYPPFAGWHVYTSDAEGNNLRLVGDCIPAEGGGGETPSPDCWFVSDDPNVLGDLAPGATNYIKLVSHDVGENDWITFNDIEVIVEYETDPNNDEVYKYYVKFDLNDIDLSDELTAARLKINVAQEAENSIAELHLVDDTLLPGDSAQFLHEASDPCYSSLVNPIKSFSCENTGIVSLNVKAAVEQALLAGQSTIAFHVSERNNDQLFAIDANGSENPPILTISQKVPQGAGGQPSGEEPSNDPNSGPRAPTYDSVVVKDVDEDSYAKYDGPDSAVIGAEFASEYNTGDLEPQDGIGAIGEDAQELYEFAIPEGVVKTLKVRMENYLVMHFDYPPFAGWNVYTSNADGDNLHLVGDCVPAEGGGGEAQPPDCWFVSDDPGVLADLAPGGTSYIKLVSHDVGENDWITFNDIEVIVEYETDPNNDNISRYYVKFDIAEFSGDVQVDSAILNLYVSEPAPDTIAEISIVDSTYDPGTTPYAIYEAEDAQYSSLINPIKSFACDTAGFKQINVKAALEDAVESDMAEIAFLITEQNEDALFTIDASGRANPPRLDIYLKSGVSGGMAEWNILPKDNGDFTLRILASNNVGVVGLSDTMVVNIYDPNLPVINSVDCLIDSTWQDCILAEYGDNLQKIRIDASDLQEIPEVRLRLSNIPDDHDFVDDQVIYQDGYFVYNTDLEISDSGQWQIEVRCSDSEGNTDTKTTTWYVPWGSLQTHLISPTTDITVPKGGSFVVEASLQCLDAECPGVKTSLQLNDPVELKYDDGTAQDYGDLGSTDSYLAVRFTPASYPAQLRTARFYVWDQTTYPFELHIWDDSGSAGAPGVDLITPFTVDPVVASAANEVAWFDIDLTDHEIVINSGDFYIGWRQIEEGKLNQVGFDTTGILYARTWGYLPGLGWINLDDWAWLNPDFYGNIMIRATMGEPGSYQGNLPTTVGPAPFYTLDDHPKSCPELDANDTCDVSFNVLAIGAVTDKAKLQAVASNNYSLDRTDPVKVTITGPETICDAANLDAVGSVDMRDLAILADQWLQTDPPLSADIHGDQSVDMLDLAILAQYWLANCE